MKLPFLFVVLLTLALTTLFGVTSAQAQSGCEFDCEPEYPPGSDSSGPPGKESLNSGVTRSIVKLIRGANGTCGSQIALRYRIDCLRVYYLKVAESLPDSGEYLPIKEAMLEAAAKLDAIVEANLDERTPPIRPREGHKPAAKRLPPIRPIKENRAEIASAQAAEVIRETELIIIRSGGDPARRTEHYTEVAAAVEDNLVILRSA